MLKLIAAIGSNNELGKGGDLCFHLKEDMKFFRETTMGSAVLMGYNTWLSLPGALKGRRNYVVSSQPVELPDGVGQVLDLTKFLADWRDSDNTCFVIGGGSIYQQTLEYCDELYLTEINAECPEADVFFPDFDKTKYDKTVIRSGEENGLKFVFAKYKLK